MAAIDVDPPLPPSGRIGNRMNGCGDAVTFAGSGRFTTCSGLPSSWTAVPDRSSAITCSTSLPFAFSNTVCVSESFGCNSSAVARSATALRYLPSK